MSNEQFFVSQVKPGMILEYLSVFQGSQRSFRGIVLGAAMKDAGTWTVYWIGSWNPFMGSTKFARTSIISFADRKRWRIVA
jgi:hypothetical protein